MEAGEKGEEGCGGMRVLRGGGERAWGWWGGRGAGEGGRLGKVSKDG